MKKILITGARSGIARALIERLKKKDYIIYASTHTNKESNILKRIYKDYDDVIPFKLDMKDTEDIKVINSLEIDILFCNASMNNAGNLIEMDIDKLKENYEVNVFGTMTLIQYFLKNNVNKNGKVIIMSSLSGIIPLKFIGGYSSTKASLIKIAEILKMELSMLGSKIKVCLIEPGLYYTGFNEYMFMQKSSKSSYFDKVINIMKLEEYVISNILSKRNLDSIVNKIESAIRSNNPRFIYRAPFIDVLVSKLYSIIKG